MGGEKVLMGVNKNGTSEDHQQKKITSLYRKLFILNQLILTRVKYIYKWAWSGVVQYNC